MKTSETTFVVGVTALVVLAYVVPGFLLASAMTSGDQSPIDQSNAAIERESDASESDAPNWFADVASERGLNYSSVRDRDGMAGTISNSGVFVTDFDNDLQSDILLIGGDRPRLFRNTGGEFQPSDVLSSINLTTAPVRTALFVDFDNDGWDDLLLFSSNETPVLLENRNGEFVRVPGAFDDRLENPVGAAAGDYDGDGCADVFVIQNGDWLETRPARITNDNLVRDNGKPNYLFRGTCSSFEPVSDAGISETRWSLSTSFVDLTGDNRPDIHVANDFNYDILYVNQGDGTFEKREISSTDRNGMASEVADVDGDGHLDVFVSNIYWTDEIREKFEQIGIIVAGSKGNNLLINQGNGTFVDRSEEFGVQNGRWGWGAAMADFDNDGDLDLFHTTRKQFVPEEARDEIDDTSFRYFKQSRFFERTGRNEFTPRNGWSLGFEVTDGRGVGRLDFDADGNLDLAVSNVGSDYRLYRNQRSDGNAVQISLQSSGNWSTLGAEVTVTTAGGTQYRVRNSRSDFLSQDSDVLHIGLRQQERVDRIQVVWPNGRETTVEAVAPNQRLLLTPDGIEDRRELE